ncbi:MAG TPA: hypothetical protein VM450_11765 [Thermomicrobiales bacterium]|nr:hypothetical protein [Thermomicrobiales bacterium]
MPWFPFRKHSHDAEPATDTPETTNTATPGRHPGTELPPHMKRLLEERGAKRQPDRTATPDERMAKLQRQRLAILYDIEQGELASEPENPWQHRVELLTEALANVQDDQKAAAEVQPSPWHPLPATPVTDTVIDTEGAATVSFAIGGNPFHYAEEVDWAERGHQLARPELEPVEGDVTPLVPADTPEALREPLAEHLAQSLFVFASDLRDRQLDGEPLPASPTLADMGKPCPVCGGWTDWRGRCEACTARKARLMELKREENRLLSERASEAEERHRLVERLPVSRRRLSDVDNEIAAAERAMGKA